MNTLLTLAVLVAGAATSDPAHELAEATRTYDLSRAEALAQAMESTGRPEAAVLRARTWLLIAELRRIAFEELPEEAVQERRALGKEIDTAADMGLAVTEVLGDSSETYRIRADLLGTKIRSRYRAGKYKQELNHAIEKALELNPKNARAWVSKAKTFVLRPEADDEDLRRGQAHMEKALELDPTLEQARLLQAYAWERLGNKDRARACYEQCLQRNRNFTPASAGLIRLND